MYAHCILLGDMVYAGCIFLEKHNGSVNGHTVELILNITSLPHMHMLSVYPHLFDRGSLETITCYRCWEMHPKISPPAMERYRFSTS